MNNTSILTINDIQNILKISRTKAYSLLKLPGFPFFRIGKSIRIRKRDFEIWLNNQKKSDILA